MNDSSQANQALAEWAALIGEWTTIGSHPYFPGVELHGRTTFGWHEGGAFVVMRSSIEHPDFPSGVAIFGSDDSTGDVTMLYFDSRGVSRHYEAKLAGNVFTWWRDTSEFSQRFRVTISPDQQVMMSEGEMSRDGGGTWEPDLSLTYKRA